MSKSIQTNPLFTRNQENPLYRRWTKMKARCSNPNTKDYKHYGKRGITVCPQWKNDSLSFIQWAVNNGFREDLQLDRRDNDGPYSPENCRFVTSEVNNNNKRPYTKTTGLPVGVQVNGKRFQAMIWWRGQHVMLGTHDTPEKASKAYQAMSKVKRMALGF